MTRAQVVGALADTCLIPEACLSCAPYANLSSASAGGLQQATADGVEEEEDVRERGKEGEKVKVGGGGGGELRQQILAAVREANYALRCSPKWEVWVRGSEPFFRH